MKTLKFKILIIGTLLLTSFMAEANFAKTIHRNWSVNQVNTLKVDNKFGNINFEKSRTDSVVIVVTVEIKDLTRSRSEYLANQIDFRFSLSDGILTASTVFSDNFKTNQEFNIVYTINIPTDKNLEILNKYGNVTLGDLNATGKFDINYGNIQGRDLKAPNKQYIDLNLKYGNASFNSINQLKANIGYGKLSADKIEDANFNTQYSIIKVNTANKVKINSKYDNIDFKFSTEVVATSTITNWSMGNITDKLILNTEYGNVNVSKVETTFKEIKIENSYGNIIIGIPYGASYQLNSDCYYCKVKHHEAEIISQSDNNNREIIKANVGNQPSGAVVVVKSRYGKVNLME